MNCINLVKKMFENWSLYYQGQIDQECRTFMSRIRSLADKSIAPLFKNNSILVDF